MDLEAARRELRRFEADCARWVRPQQFAPVEEVTPLLVLRMLARHVPLRAVGWFRLANALRHVGVRGTSGWIQRRLLRLYGLELAPGSDIGGGLYIAHPVGCVLVAERVGENATVISQVTFGTRTDARWPRIGDHCFFGAGARVLGGIEIGDGASVGANAVDYWWERQANRISKPVDPAVDSSHQKPVA